MTENNVRQNTLNPFFSTMHKLSVQDLSNIEFIKIEESRWGGAYKSGIVQDGAAEKSD